MSGKSRLSDIAKRAGVSEATVSRVLNNKEGVAPATREAVLTAVDVLGYHRPARLPARPNALVGIIVPELTNPVFPQYAQVIETLLARSGFTPMLCSQTTGGVHEDEYVQMLLAHGVAGIVYVSGQHADTEEDSRRYHRLRERGLPIVLINGFLEGVDAPFVSTDHATAAENAVEHLAQLGHRSIGLAVGPARYAPVQARCAGFRAAMRRYVGTEGELVEHSLFSVVGGHTAAVALIRRGATALVCGSDLMALGAIRAARSMGLDVPGDISIVGSDDSPLMTFTDPPLTTMRQDVTAVSAAAVRALVDEINGVSAVRGEFIVRAELVVRGSTGPAAATIDLAI